MRYPLFTPALHLESSDSSALFCVASLEVCYG